MDKNVQTVMMKKLKRCAVALEKNGFVVEIAEDKSKVLPLLDKYIKDGDSVSCGGSMSLFECGVPEYLKNRNVEYLDRYAQGLTPEQIKGVFKSAMTCDVYLTSSNAITEKGELVNVDGNGNRVAAMLYGPESVVVVAGYNKICDDVDAAYARIGDVAAPANVERLGVKAPCAETGKCMNCSSPNKVCCLYTVMKYVRLANRVKVILVADTLGY